MSGLRSTRTTRSARLVKLVALLSVLGVAGVGAFAAFGAPPVPAPTISSKPANPTNSVERDVRVQRESGATSYQCALDTPTFTACTSPKSYTGLAAGSHTFQVRAVKGSATSSAVSYTWTIDLTAPTLTSIARVGPTPDERCERLLDGHLQRAGHQRRSGPLRAGCLGCERCRRSPASPAAARPTP